MRARCFAQVDCNNFFVSCELVFNPSLRGRPLVVLSNNDGCIISRSPEAKLAGVPMGAPLHEVKPLLRKIGAKAMSSNFALYGDMSNRVMGLLKRYAKQQEIYSIDECFLDLGGEPDPETLACRIREDVLAGLGLPVCVGVAPTKTLAKVANNLAKANPASGGVFNFMSLDEAERLALLDGMPVEEVWGIGRKLGHKLRLAGINHAGALVRANRDWLKSRFGIIQARLADELAGVACLDLETVHQPKKTIISSRSFGRKVTELEELYESVSMHASKVGERLRRQGSQAAFVQVSICSSAFSSYESLVRDSEVVALTPPSNDTRQLITAARVAVARLYRRGVRYHKAGVCVFELSQASHAQDDLFAGAARDTHSEKLMQTVDEINRKLGRGTLRWAAEGLAQPWAARRGSVSPEYTTRWDQLLVVKAK